MAETVENRSAHTVYEKDQVGSVEISDEVVTIIAGLAASEVEGVASLAGNITYELVSKLGIKNLAKGVRVEVDDEGVTADLTLNIAYGYNIPAVTEKVQERVRSAVENMTGLTVREINVRVADVAI